MGVCALLTKQVRRKTYSVTILVFMAQRYEIFVILHPKATSFLIVYQELVQSISTGSFICIIVILKYLLLLK